MCFQLTSQRRAELDSGTNAVSLWAGVCAITHTNTLRTATRSAGAVMQRSGSLPQQGHTHPHTLLPCLLPPRQALSLLRRVRQEGLQTTHLSISRLGTWGPQSSVPSHTAGPVLLYHEGSSCRSPYPGQTAQCYRSGISPKLASKSKQPLITAVRVFPCEHT